MKTNLFFPVLFIALLLLGGFASCNDDAKELAEKEKELEELKKQVQGKANQTVGNLTRAAVPLNIKPPANNIIDITKFNSSYKNIAIGIPINDFPNTFKKFFIFLHQPFLDL